MVTDEAPLFRAAHAIKTHDEREGGPMLHREALSEREEFVGHLYASPHVPAHPNRHPIALGAAEKTFNGHRLAARSPLSTDLCLSGAQACHLARHITARLTFLFHCFSEAFSPKAALFPAGIASKLENHSKRPSVSHGIKRPRLFTEWSYLTTNPLRCLLTPGKGMHQPAQMSLLTLSAPNYAVTDVFSCREATVLVTLLIHPP